MLLREPQPEVEARRPVHSTQAIRVLRTVRASYHTRMQILCAQVRIQITRAKKNVHIAFIVFKRTLLVSKNDCIDFDTSSGLDSLVVLRKMFSIVAACSRSRPSKSICALGWSFNFSKYSSSKSFVSVAVALFWCRGGKGCDNSIFESFFEIGFRGDEKNITILWLFKSKKSSLTPGYASARQLLEKKLLSCDWLPDIRHSQLSGSER